MFSLAFANDNEEIFTLIPYYFKDSSIDNIVITQQCNNKKYSKSLTSQQIKTFFTLATKVPVIYLGYYFASSCYIEGYININNHKTKFSIDSLGVAWIHDGPLPHAMYICEDEECPIRAYEDDGA